MSRAPASSGLGKGTVGKSGSGSAWAATRETLVKPASARTREVITAPTPCMAVRTMRRFSRADASPEARADAQATYSSRGSTASMRSSFIGTSSAGGAALMAAAISASKGGTIWTPRPSPCTTVPPR